MVTINGIKFYDMPGSCGTCSAFLNGKTSQHPGDARGICVFFDETHHSWITPPRRCQKLFRKAFSMPEGSELVITVKPNQDETD
jgi:hypothetical protein